MKEFELIQRFFAHGYPSSRHTDLGVGDDASIITPPRHQQLVQSLDTQVEGVHFPANAPAHLIAERALRCAVSDLAAMGATPQGFHLGLTLPAANEHWLQDFADGLRTAAGDLNISLLGGDTTQGQQVVISISVQGFVESQQALTRRGAQVGDQLWLSGLIGAAALALPEVLANPAHDDGWAYAYYHPKVHLELGQALAGIANSCIDVSDGLLQDAGHIAQASGVGLSLQLASIHTAVDTQTNIAQWTQCLTGGDDYQLLFTVPTSKLKLMEALQSRFPDVHPIGHCVPAIDVKNTTGLYLDGSFAQREQLRQQSGFQHF